MRKYKIVLVLLVMALLTGCAKARTEAPVPDIAESPSFGAGAPQQMPLPTEAPRASQADNGKAVDATDRMVVRTAQLRVSVADPAIAVTEVSKLATSLGGYVVSSTIYESARTEIVVYQNSSITIRVPSERLEEAMSKIRAMAADPKSGVLNESISGQDVTSEYVDSEARLKNLEAAEAQLVELLDNAPDLQYTMEVFRELTNIREQIEVIKGRMQYLKESTALSAISADFVAEASLKPIEIGGWKPQGTVRNALQALINTGQKLVDGLIWFGLYCLPFLLPLGLVVYFITKAMTKRRRERKAREFMEVRPVSHPTPPEKPQI